MKKRSLKSLKLNKESISNLDGRSKEIKGGKTYFNCTDTTYNCPPSYYTACDWSVCRCL